MRYAYYPGCSLKSTAMEYDLSTLALCGALGIELAEIPEWNCCGASAAHMTDGWLAYALPGRNLALAEKAGLDMVTPCPACFQRLRRAQLETASSPELKVKLSRLSGLPYQGKYDVSHLLDVIYREVGPESIKERVKKPLQGLKLVGYYGCYLVRPPKLTGFDDPESPRSMDVLLEAAGAEVPDWDGKVRCCGGNLSISEKRLTRGLVAQVIEAAREVGAEALVTACPLCQINLERNQEGKETLPAFYFTELLCLALGLPVKSWLKKHLISPANLLKSHRLIS